MARIEVRNLRKEYDVSGGTEVAVDDVSFTIEDGEFLTVVGPSGCGKTTTLRSVAGLETPTSGTIEIAGEEVTSKPPQKRNLSMVFQDIALYPHMSVRENIQYPLKLDGVSDEEKEDRIQEATKTLQINELLDKNPGELSGGQAQRVSLARAIVRDPDAFLLDEPMSDLDAKLKMEMRKEVGKIHNELDATMLYVTHDQEEAMTLSDKLAVMNDGNLEQVGDPDEVYRNPANVFVASFIGSPSINLLEGTLAEADDETVTVEFLSGQMVTMGYEGDSDQLVGTTTGDTVTLGFRPRYTEVTDSDDNGISATVTLNESIGDEVIQYLEGPQGEIRAVVPHEDAHSEDRDVSISPQMPGTYLFHGDTGKRLLRGERRPQPAVIE